LLIFRSRRAKTLCLRL